MKKNLMIFRNKKAMAKISFAILGIISLFLAVMFVSGVVADEPTYDKELTLDNKITCPTNSDGSADCSEDCWDIIGNDMYAILKYNSIGLNFEYSLKAYDLDINTEYSLIYYADPWPGNNPGALIATATSDSAGYLEISEGVLTDMNFPHPNDDNAKGTDYCTNGCNPSDSHCPGAKIWLVPSGDYDGSSSLTGWNPEKYLFETDLINTYPECVPEDTEDCGVDQCLGGTKTCQQDGTWGDCSTAGNSCGTCKPFGCSLDEFSFTVEILTSGTKICTSEGTCSDTCTYRHECADDDLDDGWPNHEIEPVSCHAQCDQDIDCEAFCEGDNLRLDGECPLSSCTCENYDTHNCNLDDGWDDTGNTRWVPNDQCTKKEQKEQAYRDYSCVEVTDSADCKYEVTDHQWVDTGITEPAYEGQSCDDGEFCTVEDVCSAGVCDGGAKDCSDGISCTDDSCDGYMGACVNTVNDGICDDGKWCNGAETCHATNDCQAGTAPIVDDGVSCTDDSCDEDNDVIVNAINHDHCDNGLWCDGFETCDATENCLDGTPVVCSNNDLPGIGECGYVPDANPFTWDYANPFTSVCSEDLNGECTTGSYAFEHSCDTDQCGAECDEEGLIDCGAELVETTCFYDSKGCDLASTCSCGYTEEDCEPGVDNQGMCHWGTQECVDVNGCTLNVEELEVGEICDPDLGPVVIIDLVEGWNLISIPIVPEESTAIADVLGNANVSRVYAYDPLISGDSGWLVYNGGGSLTFMTAGYGYWIYADSDTEIKVKGDLINEPNGNPTAPPSRNLVAGWNLIGHYGLDEKPIGDALYSLRNKMHGLDTWNAIWPAETSGNMLSGQGYWLAIDGSLTVYTPNI